MAQSELEKLKALIASDSAILQGLAGSGDIKEASRALAAFAADRQIKLSPEEIEGIFSARDAEPTPDMQPLDDAVLDQVSGGGSPYCVFTKGCYCIFTK